MGDDLAKIAATLLEDLKRDIEGDDVQTAWLAEFSQAAATLYVGYKLGEQITEVGKALVDTIRAIGKIAEGIANILDRLAQVIDAINRAVELINRKIDAAFMAMHIADMRTASDEILDTLRKLDKFGDDNVITNPDVRDLVLYLRERNFNLVQAIRRFLGQDGRPYTIASFINCSPSIALWAQSYTYVERYQPVERREGPWRSMHHLEIVTAFTEFFDFAERSVALFREELGSNYYAPNMLKTCRFETSKFVETDIPIRDEYWPGEPRHDKLFVRKSGYPFDIFVTEPKEFGRRYAWEIARGNGDNSSNPSLVKAAVGWNAVLLPERQRRLDFVANYGPIIQKRAEVMEALAKPVGWP